MKTRAASVLAGHVATLEVLRCWLGLPCGASVTQLQDRLGPPETLFTVADAIACLHDCVRLEDVAGAAALAWSVVHHDGAAWRVLEGRVRRRFLRMSLSPPCEDRALAAK